jgi:aspartate carbamoyltransferase catalytic subunit
MDKFKHRNILSTKQFSRKDLEVIFEQARDMEKIISRHKPGKMLD